MWPRHVIVALFITHAHGRNQGHLLTFFTYLQCDFLKSYEKNKQHIIGTYDDDNTIIQCR